MFLTFLLVGVVGFIAMVLLSAFAGHGGGHGHSHGHEAHHGHSSHGHHSSHEHHGHTETASPWLQVLSWFSPRTIFTLSLGFGATGLAFPSLPIWLVVPIALVGAVAFEGLLVKPYWNALLGFASQPAQTLESLEGSTATAVMRFNASGEGLVSLLLDGQERQVLGTLEPLQRGKPVAVGEVLRVLAVQDNGQVTVQKR